MCRAVTSLVFLQHGVESTVTAATGGAQLNPAGIQAAWQQAMCCSTSHAGSQQLIVWWLLQGARSKAAVSGDPPATCGEVPTQQQALLYRH